MLRAVADTVEEDAHRWVVQHLQAVTSLLHGRGLGAALHPVTARVMLRHAFTARLWPQEVAHQCYRMLYVPLITISTTVQACA